MLQLTSKELEIRTKFFAYFVIGVFVLLGSRLWFLQIIKGYDFEQKSLANSVRLVTIPAPRGIFYDRKHRQLVNSRLAYSVSIIPRQLPEDRETVFRRLGNILGMSADDIRSEVDKGQTLPYFPVRLARDVDARTVTRVEEARLDLPGVIVEEIPVRNYLLAHYGSHLFGYLGKISAQEWAELKSKGYAPSDVVGKTGLEKQYETDLRGKDGGQQVEVNRVNRPVRVLGTVDPIPGNSLILTIDRDVQEAADAAIDAQLEWIRKNTAYANAKAAAVIAIDPNTGAVLAMTSKPDFDPGRFVGGVPAAYWNELARDPFNPFQDRVTTAALAPGSTFKAVTAIAALSEKVTTPSEIFWDGGRDPVWPQKTCWIYPETGRGHGRVNITDGLKVSCNTVFYELGRRLGIDRLAKWARTLGLGVPTGFDLYPGESAGNVPDEAWKKRVFKRPDFRIWYPIETLDVAIGQGALQVTPIQLATLYSAIANGGTIYRPYVVQSVVSPSGQVVKAYGPKVSRKVEITPEVRDTVVEGLGDVVAGGTAAGAFVGFPIAVAGKTGSAELSAYSKDVHAWFAAFAPIDHPEMVVVVMIERGGHGGTSAAPVARKMFEAFFGFGKKPAASKGQAKAQTQAQAQTPQGAPVPRTPGTPSTAPNAPTVPSGRPVPGAAQGEMPVQDNTLPSGQAPPPDQYLPQADQLAPPP